MKKSTCQTGPKKNVISKAVFERELRLCKKLHKESGKKGCNWGKCENCGVIPLLWKLHKGVLVEDKKALKELKDKIFVT